VNSTDRDIIEGEEISAIWLQLNHDTEVHNRGRLDISPSC
jgi:hypothetical protein